MNAYYNNTNVGIREGRARGGIRIVDGIITLICAIVAVLTSSVAVKIEKAVLSTALFIAFFGLIGSMDAGNIGMLFGTFLCVICALLELVILKSIVSASRKAKN